MGKLYSMIPFQPPQFSGIYNNSVATNHRELESKENNIPTIQMVQFKENGLTLSEDYFYAGANNKEVSNGGFNLKISKWVKKQRVY